MNQRSRLSLLVIQIFIASLMVALFGRLFYLQVAAGPKYRDAALSIQSRDVVTPANRGFIVDSSGVPMALNSVGLAVTVDRTKIDKLPDKGVSVVHDLVTLLGLNFDDVWQRTRLLGNFLRVRRLDAGPVLVFNLFLLPKLQIHRLRYVLLNAQIAIQVFLQHHLLLEVIRRLWVSTVAMSWVMSDL